MSKQYVAGAYMYKGIPFDNTYQNTFQASALTAKVAVLNENYEYDAYTNLMYPKFDTTTDKGTLRLEVENGKAEQYNYAYINDGKDHIRFCFVHGCRYINDGSKENHSIYEFDLEIDDIMTYVLSEDQFYACPIERQHAVDTDSLTNNQFSAEDIPLGEYIHNNWITHSEIDTSHYYMIIYYIDPTEENKFVNLNRFNGLPQGLKMYSMSLDASDALWEELVNNKLPKIDNPDNIVAITTVPAALINQSQTGEVLQNYSIVKDDLYWKVFDEIPDTLDNYKPHNTKLLQYPYSFGRLYNDVGNYSVLQFDKWSKIDVGTKYGYLLAIEGSANMPVSLKCGPIGYDGVNGKEPNALHDNMTIEPTKKVEISNFPLGSWVSDSYQRYISANNRANFINAVSSRMVATSNAIGSSISTMTNAIAKNDTGLAAGGSLINIGVSEGARYLSIEAGLLANRQRASDAVDQTNGDTSNGNIEYYYLHKRFRFSHVSIKSIFAESIDRYFSRYGYSQNLLIDKPKSNARPKFTYIKTAGYCIKPFEDYCPNNNQLTKINNIMMNGITFWNLSTTKEEMLNFDKIFEDNSNGDF